MGIPLLFTFLPEADQIVQWGPVATGLTWQDPSPVYVNDATGTATLFDPDGNAVDGATDIVLTYVGASNGIYRGTVLGSGFNPPLGPGYSLVIQLSSPTDGDRKWTEVAEVALSVSQ